MMVSENLSSLEILNIFFINFLLFQNIWEWKKNQTYVNKCEGNGEMVIDFRNKHVVPTTIQDPSTIQLPYLHEATTILQQW